MQNNINNNERDAFSDFFREKLKNHKVPVDVTNWNKIESRLKTKKERIIPFWFWISGGAAVASLALLFILRPLTEPKDSIVKSTSIKIHQVKMNNGQIANYMRPKVVQSTKRRINAISFKTLVSNQVKKMITFDYQPAQIVIRDTTISKTRNKNIAGNNMKEENNVAESPTENKDSLSGKMRYIPNSAIEKPANNPIAKSRNKNGWLLAASFGANGNVPAANGNYGLTVDANRNISSFANTATTGSSDNFSNITYSPPVSVGLIVRKNLYQTWSLESGLEYTYLLTAFENNLTQRNDAKLHLHYIGIPINLIAGLWNNSNWEVYLSGGGMLEKGIRSIYENYRYVNNQSITTTASTDIVGVQWSVNGAVGITYKIERNFGIFFEPKISYFFDDNQPTSARTAYPVVIGLMAGIRFQFK